MLTCVERETRALLRRTPFVPAEQSRKNHQTPAATTLCTCADVRHCADTRAVYPHSCRREMRAQPLDPHRDVEEDYGTIWGSSSACCDRLVRPLTIRYEERSTDTTQKGISTPEPSTAPRSLITTDTKHIPCCSQPSSGTPAELTACVQPLYVFSGPVESYQPVR